MAALLSAVFFLSGLAALVFETLWFRQAGLAFGNSVWASSLVLSGFMAGLALGNALAGRAGRRIDRPVLAYGVLEIVIAVAGVGLVLWLPRLGVALEPVFDRVVLEPWILNATRFALAFVLLLVPSTSMGLTLPLLTQALSRTGRDFGSVLGRLYGWNTLGAMSGALLSETVLIGAVGIRGSALVAAGVNLAVAAMAVALDRRVVRPADTVLAEAGGRIAWARGLPWMAAAWATGFTLLGLEVVWMRILLLWVFGSALVFAVMLAVILAGIALGGLLAARWLRAVESAHDHASTAAFAAALVTLACYAVLPRLMGAPTQGPVADVVVVAWYSVALMAPASLLSGLMFSLFGARLRHEMPSAASTAGALTLANTVGAAIGALVAGFVLLPGLGMEASLFVLALVYVGVGLGLLRHCRTPRTVLMPLVVLMLAVLAGFPFGSMLEHHIRIAAERYSAGRQWRVEAVREGLIETAIYLEQGRYGRILSTRLVTNSVSMSSNEFNNRRYMKLFVYLPVALHPRLERGLLISYGVGSTAAAMVATDSIDRLDVVDVSADIIDGSALIFPDPANDPVRDPRVRVHIEDGRYFLQTTEERYDLITGEPPPPMMAGIVSLYTREYFQLMYDRLREGGIVTYWLPLHSLSEEASLAVIAAFADVFPDASLWHGSGADLMLMGSRNLARSPSPKHFSAQWRDRDVVGELEGLGIERAEQLGALFVGDADYLAHITEGVAPLVDDRPHRILGAPDFLNDPNSLFSDWCYSTAAADRFRDSELIARIWPRELIPATLPYFEVQRAINLLLDYPLPTVRHFEMLDGLLTTSALKAPILWKLGSNADFQTALPSLTPEERATPPWQYHQAVRWIAERQLSRALPLLEAAEGDPRFATSARVLRIYALCMTGRVAEAEPLAIDPLPGEVTPADEAAWRSFLALRFGLALPPV